MHVRLEMLSLLLLPVLSACASNDSNDPGCQCPLLQVRNCGHRGTGSKGGGNPYPENTLASFAQAEREGAQMVELDLQHTADGVVVVMHDFEIDRTTTGQGCLSDVSLADLKQLDAAEGTSLEGTGITVPTLDEVLAGTALDLNLEVKISDSGDCATPSLEALAADIVAAVQTDSRPRFIQISSFDLEFLLAVQQIDPALSLGLLSLTPNDAEKAKAHGFAALNLFGGLYGAEAIHEIQAAGLQANVWTIDDPEKITEFLELEVGYIITNQPDVVHGVRQQRCGAICGNGI